MGNSMGSSCLAYAVRSAALKDQYLSGFYFKQMIWDSVQKKLNQDYQIEKQWVRTRNGEVSEAFYYNGDGIVVVKKNL